MPLLASNSVKAPFESWVQIMDIGILEDICQNVR